MGTVSRRLPPRSRILQYGLIVVETRLRLCSPCFVLDPRTTARCARTREGRCDVGQVSFFEVAFEYRVKKRVPERR